MVKYGSVSSASVQLTSSHCQAHHCQVRPVKVRSPSLGALKGACQSQRITCGLTWLKSKEHSVSEVTSTLRTQIIIYRHCIISQKSDFSQHLIRLSSFHSLSGFLGSPLLSLSSSRVISIFDSFFCSFLVVFVVVFCSFLVVPVFGRFCCFRGCFLLVFGRFRCFRGRFLLVFGRLRGRFFARFWLFSSFGRFRVCCPVRPFLGLFRQGASLLKSCFAFDRDRKSLVILEVFLGKNRTVLNHQGKEGQGGCLGGFFVCVFLVVFAVVFGRF